MDNNDLTPEELEQFEEYLRKRDGKTVNPELIIFNDDVNSFEHVTECLIKYCNHETLQAIQCTMIIHNNGKCSVKVASTTTLKPILNSLLEKGLKAEIQ